MGVGMRTLTAGAAVAAVAVAAVVYVRMPVGGLPGRPATPDGTVAVYGQGGTFGVGQRDLPSGQSMAYRLVPGWAAPPGVMASETVVADDGTVIWGSRSLNNNIDLPTSSELVLGTYQPAANRNVVERVRTSTGRTEVRDPHGRPAAPSITGLQKHGRSVVFTASSGIFQQDLATTGAWPVLGVMTIVDGRWRVTSQWTGRQLREAGGSAGAAACPARAADTAESDCRQFADLAVLPRSGHVIATQQYGTGPDVGPQPPQVPPGPTAWRGGTPGGNGGFAAIRLDGPTPTVAAQYTYPEARIPGILDGAALRVIPESVSADPTSVPGDERFVVTFNVAPTGLYIPRFLQEFSYDSATGAVRPVSAPFIPGDHSSGFGEPFLGFAATLYDRNGNLWAGRADAPIGVAGGKLAVYTKDGRRRCAATAGSNVSAEKGMVAFGRACAPDFNLRPATSTLTSHGFVEDPATGAIVSLHWGGHIQAYLPTGTGAAMTFEVSNALDLGRKLMTQREDDVPVGWVGGFDATGRLWMTGSSLRGGGNDARIDHYLYSIGVGDLFDPAPVDLATTPGHSTTVQAERTTTIATRTARVGQSVEVMSVAATGPCNDLFSVDACGVDSVRGDGYVLRDDSGYGVLDGTAIDYRVRVAVAGTYRLSFRTSTFRGHPASISLTVAGQTVVTPVDTDGAWLTIAATKTVTLPAGAHTVRLSSPPKGGGWFLNHLLFQRA